MATIERAGPVCTAVREDNAMKKILVAYDGSEPAKHALEQAADLAAAMGGTVTVVSVVPVHPGRIAVDPWDDRAVHDAELGEANAILEKRHVTWDVLEPAGDPARTIERIAEDGGYDTVILGSRGLGTAARILQGSVSEHVATHSKATVVIVH
jgi:nucleotide-binding universal stress UspA family protein